ncbi:hypothetical protein FH972_021302 [Carpinus fangiana]|uniref:DOMON domain-containing protein n=1 Tax=Carpinus fangiana TaxID=176857 RepID=A0A5N6KR43_9ROSI|nr:hypothetical protein FH972_021302 [Carpinus fangiana]
MKFSTKPLAVVAGAIVAVDCASVPTPTAAEPSYGPTLTPPYPATLNSTASYGQQGTFRLAIRSSNTAYDGHNVQLKSISPESDVSQVGVSLGADPVALFGLAGSQIQLYHRNDMNQAIATGNVGGLLTNSAQGETEESSFVTASPTTTNAGKDFAESSKSWQLLGGGDGGEYDLFQVVEPGITHGFAICGGNDPAFRFLIYQETKSTNGTEIPDWCIQGETVGLYTVLGLSCESVHLPHRQPQTGYLLVGGSTERANLKKADKKADKRIPGSPENNIRAPWRSMTGMALSLNQPCLVAGNSGLLIVVTQMMAASHLLPYSENLDAYWTKPSAPGAASRRECRTARPTTGVQNGHRIRDPAERRRQLHKI